jgi:5-methylcytosine-specific restriction endonuclease McrA
MNPEYFREYRKKNSDFLTAKALKWAKDNPEKHDARASRYRSRKYSETVEIFTREDVANRDGRICHVCELPVDPAIKYPDPLSGELDHVIPVTSPKYPGHIWSNAALAHSRCNKNTRALPPTLRCRPTTSCSRAQMAQPNSPMRSSRIHRPQRPCTAVALALRSRLRMGRASAKILSPCVLLLTTAAAAPMPRSARLCRACCNG